MFCVLLITIGIYLVVVYSNESMDICERLLHEARVCCRKDSGAFVVPPFQDIKECFQLPRKPPSCEMELRIAAKEGLILPNGTINKIAISNQLKKEFKSDPDLSCSIQEKCINGNISKYGSKDLCDLMKIKLCTDVQIIRGCDEWNNEDDCNGVNTLVKQCTKIFP